MIIINPSINRRKMKKAIKIMALSIVLAFLCTPATAQTVADLEAGINAHEEAIKDKQDSIKDIDKQIKELKKQIKELENQKKQLNNEIKSHTVARKEKFSHRDNKVFENEVEDVLFAPYNKADVEDALKSFEGMETKEVLKKRKLLENYGDYTKNLKEFMEEQQHELSKGNWARLSVNDEGYKKFEKGLKKTKYWSIYNKKENNPSIDYLDRVMDKLVQFKNGGLKNESQYNEILNMLYAN